MPSEAIENKSIGWSHGRLTGPIFLRAVDQLHSLEFRSARSKDWPVNLRMCAGAAWTWWFVRQTAAPSKELVIDIMEKRRAACILNGV